MYVGLCTAWQILDCVCRVAYATYGNGSTTAVLYVKNESLGLQVDNSANRNYSRTSQAKLFIILDL
jgi:hypothetical protein